MCFTLPLVFTVIKLGYTMTYENREAVKTMKQSLQTIWPRYNMHCLFFSTAFSSLHDKSIETDGKRSCRIEESIAL